MFNYALMAADGTTILEYRTYPQQMQVGPGALGEFADMVAVDPSAMPKATPVQPTPRQWLERLAPATQQSIFGAAAANPAILGWLFKACGSAAIDVTSAETIAGVGALVTAGVLSPSDQTTLLTP